MPMERGGYVYIMTNKNHTTLYTGVTSDLEGRAWEHKNHIYPNSFTDRYNLEKLVYYDFFGTIEEAIAAEKQIKSGSRRKKEDLIASLTLNGVIYMMKLENGINHNN